MCDCRKEVNQKLKELTGDDKAELVSGFIWDETEIDGKKQHSMRHSLMLAAMYRDKKRDGSLKEKATPHYNVIVSFCPFCGEKIKKDVA